MVTPEDKSRIVFSRGILIGLNELIEWGGQACPNSIVGEILLWKNDQKKDTKKKISDVMNKIIPVFRPFITIDEWLPWLVDSRWISRHQEKAITKVVRRETRMIVFLTLFIKISPAITSDMAPLEAIIGQGLCSTRWKGLNFIIILFDFCSVQSNQCYKYVSLNTRYSPF